MKAKLQQLLRYFLIGVLALVPVLLAVNIVLFMERLIRKLFSFVYGYSDNLPFTLLVLLVSIAALCSIGFSISNYGRSLIITAIDKVLDRLPFLNTINRIAKKVIAMLSHQDKGEPREVVYLEYPRQGLWVIGYITNHIGKLRVVFVPTSPNPTSGFTVIVDQEQLRPAGMDIEQATAFVMSIGAEFADPDLETCLQPRAGGK